MTRYSRPSYDLNLTAEEVQAVVTATPEQIAEAVGECVKDKAFWVGLVEAFLEGLLRGGGRY